MKQIARYTTVSIKGILKICLLIFVKNHFVKNQLERQALNKVAEERRTGTLWTYILGVIASMDRRLLRSITDDVY